jgi:WD40 repeat protein
MMQARKICGIVCVLGGVLCGFAFLAVSASAGRMNVSLLGATAIHLTTGIMLLALDALFRNDNAAQFPLNLDRRRPMTKTLARLMPCALLLLATSPTQALAQPKEPTTLKGHTGPCAVAFSPDGKTLATGSHDKTIKLWDVKTGKEQATLEGHTHPVSSVTFSPDGKTLASGSENGVRLWDVATGKTTLILKGRGAGEHPTFSTDGKTLAVAGVNWFDDTITLWDVGTGKFVKALTHKGHPVIGLVFLPGDSVLVSASAGGEYAPSPGSIMLWDVETGKPKTTLSGPADRDLSLDEGWIVSLACSPDGKTLASASNSRQIRLWDLATGKGTLTINAGWSVTFSPDGKTLATGSRGNTIKLWDAGTGKELATLKGHTDDVWSLAFSPDGKTLASGSKDNTVKLWDVETGK